MVKRIGKEDGSLHIFRNGSGVKEDEINQHKKMAASVANQDCNLWHKRLGHSSGQVLGWLDLLQNNEDSDLLNKCLVFRLSN